MQLADLLCVVSFVLERSNRNSCESKSGRREKKIAEEINIIPIGGRHIRKHCWPIKSFPLNNYIATIFVPYRVLTLETAHLSEMFSLRVRVELCENPKTVENELA